MEIVEQPQARNKRHRVTHKVRRSSGGHLYVCAGCGKLGRSSRSDKLTCSTACRVAAHRSGYLIQIREIANQLDVAPAIILQAQAVALSRRGLGGDIDSGPLTMGAVQRRTTSAWLDRLHAEVTSP